MNVRPIDPSEIERNLARFDTLQPRQTRFESDRGIPVAAYELLAAHRIYQLMAPPGCGGAAAFPAIHGDEGLALSICECPPGNGPALHAHQLTTETFVCLSGRFEVVLGEQAGPGGPPPAVLLDRFDAIRVPRNVFRKFTNVASETAYLLVLIQGDNRAMNDVAFAPSVGRMIADRFGAETLQRFEQHTGMRFDARLEATKA